MSEQKQPQSEESPTKPEAPPMGLIACCGAAAVVATFVSVCILVKLFRWAFF